MTQSASFSSFERGCQSIASLIRCADVAALHAPALIRAEEPNLSVINKILSEGGVSQLAHSWQWYMTKNEYKEFGEKGHIRAACEHIVFASYVALEAYLISKFKEYFDHLYKAPDAQKLKALSSGLSR